MTRATGVFRFRRPIGFMIARSREIQLAPSFSAMAAAFH